MLESLSDPGFVHEMVQSQMLVCLCMFYCYLFTLKIIQQLKFFVMYFYTLIVLTLPLSRIQDFILIKHADVLK